ncbi:glycine-rich domain-containing protein [Streptomyces marincola]|uniref:glycine-rich domain-containing protein n=1 Tax=Streptomyces marincola TaxID=2878388 RepID=UPI001CF2E783|nr:hypothetical protein [Streptomyces marincola]UCM91486.1 hypothetical protein LC193_28010 [Streptomyces marincola]
MSTATVPVARNARELLTPEEFAAVAATVQDTSGVNEHVAARITEQALAFVAVAADAPHAALAPSRTVDEGWHALILHTRVYERLCRRLGRVVHHHPERPGSTDATCTADWLTRTTDAIRQAGYGIDEELWRGPDDPEAVHVAAPVQHTPRPANCSPIETRPKPKPKSAPTPAEAGTV